MTRYEKLEEIICTVLEMVVYTMKGTRKVRSVLRKKIINLLAIVANIAIITGLVTDTCHRLATRRKKEVTHSLDDEYDKV